MFFFLRPDQTLQSYSSFFKEDNSSYTEVGGFDIFKMTADVFPQPTSPLAIDKVWRNNNINDIAESQSQYQECDVATCNPSSPDGVCGVILLSL